MELAELVTAKLIEVGDELAKGSKRFPTAVSLMEEVGRRVAAQLALEFGGWVCRCGGFVRPMSDGSKPAFHMISIA